MTSSDKRIEKRKSALGALEFYDDSGSLMTGHGRLVDLSTSGALAETTLTLEKGQMIRLHLRPAHGKITLDLTAKVIRTYQKGTQQTYGLQFTELSTLQLRRLKSLL